MTAADDQRAARRVQGTYYTLMLGNTLAASNMQGINSEHCSTPA